MGNDRRPDGAVKHHDDAEEKAENAGDANGQKALGHVTKAEQDGSNSNCDEFAHA